MFYGISILKDFAKFNWKTRALYSFFDKAAVVDLQYYLKQHHHKFFKGKYIIIHLL